MADESGEHRAPSAERSSQPPRDGGSDQADRASSRRRIIITSLLAPPAVMTLGARSARAKKNQDPSANCTASLEANPHTSHPCGVLPP